MNSSMVIQDEDGTDEVMNPHRSTTEIPKSLGKKTMTSMPKQGFSRADSATFEDAIHLNHGSAVSGVFAGADKVGVSRSNKFDKKVSIRGQADPDQFSLNKQPSTLRLPPSASGESRSGDAKKDSPNNSEKPIEKATAENYVNGLLTRLWNKEEEEGIKKRDLGSPLNSSARHQKGGMYHAEDGNRKRGMKNF